MLQSSAILIAGGLAGATLTNVTETAEAAEADLTVTGDEVEIRGQEVTAVWLEIDAEWAYEVPSEESPDDVTVDVLAGTDSDDLDVVDSVEARGTFLSSDGSESFEVDLVGADVVDADDLTPTDGGETVETTVYVGVEMRLYDDSELVIAADSATDSATITVEKDDYDPNEHGSVGGAGELLVELE